MSKKKGERILGPYEQHNGWRVVEIDAQGTRSSTLCETEAKALRYIELLQAELAKSEHTTETALAEYKKHLHAKGNKEDSIRQTTWAIGQFFLTPVALTSLTEKKCAELYEALRTRPTRTGKPMSADSHRNTLSQVRTFLAWCIGKRWLTENPCANVHGIGKRRPRGKSLGKAGNELRVKDARAWYETAVYLAHRGDEGAVAALVALLLGMRASEIVSRRVADLDEDTAPGDLLWIPCAKTPAGRRTLEVPEVLRPYLVKLADGKAPDAYLFQTEDGGAHWRDWIRKNVARICGKAKVLPVTAHAMRGLLATITADRGAAGHVIAATLGHENTRTLKTAYAAPGSLEAGDRRRGLVVLQGGAAKAS